MTYQASDLSRNYRSILHRTRHKDILIADSDVESLNNLNILIEDWIATAHAWSDDKLAKEITEVDVNLPIEALV